MRVAVGTAGFVGVGDGFAVGVAVAAGVGVGLGVGAATTSGGGTDAGELATAVLAEATLAAGLLRTEPAALDELATDEPMADVAPAADG